MYLTLFLITFDYQMHWHSNFLENIPSSFKLSNFSQNFPTAAKLSNIGTNFFTSLGSFQLRLVIFNFGWLFPT